jgi:hypothetical protein
MCQKPDCKGGSLGHELPSLAVGLLTIGLARSEKLAYDNLGLTQTARISMDQNFNPGDDLIFQLESGFGLLRVLAVEQEGPDRVWHLMAYEELFPDVETAERALMQPENLHVRTAHMALTNRAFERTPAARLGNRPVISEELTGYRRWVDDGDEVSDRSALLMLGLR